MRLSIGKFVVFALVISIVVCSCSSSKKIENLNDLNGKRFGVPAGPLTEAVVLSAFPLASVNIYNTLDEAIDALKTRKIHVVAYDVPILSHKFASDLGLFLLGDNIIDYDYAFAVSLANQDYKIAIDKTIELITISGIHEDMLIRWFLEDGEVGTMPNIRLSRRNGTLRFGTSAIREPFSFFDEGGNIIGFDIELAHYIAQGLEMGLEVINMQYAALIPSVMAGRVDMIGAGIPVTEERAKSITFSHPYFQGGIGAIIKK